MMERRSQGGGYNQTGAITLRPNLWLTASLLSFSLLVTAADGSIRAAENKDEEVAPQERLTEINSAISQIEDWLNSAANNRTGLETELREATQQIAAANLVITEQQTAITALETELAALTERTTQLEQEKNAQQDVVERAVRASYKSGRESYLKLLLNQEDPSESARMLRYYSDFNTERLSRIQAFRATLAELESTAVTIAAASQEMLNRQGDLETQFATLSERQTTRQALLQSLDDDITARSGELEQLTADRGRLEELITEINDAIANIPPPEQLTPFSEEQGRLPWPVVGSVLHNFGESYSDDNLHRQGVVLAAEVGSPVRAIHPGRVVFSDWLRGSGMLVVVDHGDGYLSLYAHNQTLVKNTGDWVNRGEALATAGTNGGTEQPGIYFEIRRHGEALDPAAWCES